MALLEIRLFGSLQVCLDGEPLTELRSEKALALLTYLAVESCQVHRREKLAGLLWPDYTEKSARTNLRRALSDLRTGIKDEQASPSYLLTTRQTIQFNLASDAWVDVSDFNALLGSRSKIPAPVALSEIGIEELEQAVSLYQGPFLEQFSLPDSAGYEEWLLLNRERYHRLALEALHALAGKNEKKGEVDSALHFVWRQLEMEPWRENAQRQLMRLLALDGRRDAALVQYESYCQELARELGTEPSQSTRTLYKRIREGEWPVNKISGDALPASHPPKKLGACPYRGLSAFREQDAPFFYGRERFLIPLREVVEKRSFCAVIGPSGSGKSSTIHAGLLPGLREKEDWLIALCRPGNRPFRSLASSLLSLRNPESSRYPSLPTAHELGAAWQEGEHSLCNAAGDILGIYEEGGRLLVVLDQFEELYSLSTGPSIRRTFLDFLFSGANRDYTYYPSPVTLLITLRADFMGEALSYRPFADLLQKRSLMLGPMNRDELREVIVEPAEKQGAAFEHGLVDRLLKDVGDAPGSLPLLEFSLTLLWHRAKKGWLTHEAYSELGEVEGALATYAEQTFMELDDGDQKRVPHILTQLVQPVQGLGDTRRIATREEIGEDNWELIRHLADQRLVVTGINEEGKETAELVHEVLIQRWGRFQSWLARNREFRVWQEGLRIALKQWVSTGKDEGALLRGMPLSNALEWLEKRGEDFSRMEEEYIRSSMAYREKQQAEEEERRQRQRAVELRARRLRGVLASVFLIATLISFFMVNFALGQRQVSRESYSRSLVASAREALHDGDTRLGLSLALAANQVKNPAPESKRVLMEAAYAPGARWSERASSIFGHLASLVTALDLDPKGQTVLLGLEDGTIIHWDLKSKKELNRLQNYFIQGQINDVAFGSHGWRALACGEDGSVSYWEVSTGEMIWRRGAFLDTCRAVDISPDGRLGLSGGLSGRSIVNPGRLTVWNLETGKVMRHFEGLAAGVVAARFTLDGTGVLASSGDTQLYIEEGVFDPKGGAVYELIHWDVEGGDVIWKREDFVENIISLDINPDGTKNLTGSFGGNITVWDKETGRVLRTLFEDREPVSAVIFTDDGHRALSGSWDGSLVHWDLDSGEVLGKFDVHESEVMDVRVTPDGHSAVSVSYTGEIILLDLLDAAEVRRFEGPRERIYDVAVSPDGRYLLSVAGDDNHGEDSSGSFLRLWDLRTEKQVRFHEFSSMGTINQIAVSPDGKTALLAGKDPDVLVWNIQAWEELGRLKGHMNPLTDLLFTPDGEHVLSASKDGSMILWRVTDREILHRRQGEGSELNSLTVSPDGRRAIFDTEEGRLVLWDLVKWEEIRRLANPLPFVDQRVSDLAYLPGGETIISCQRDGNVIEWDVETGERVRFLGEHNSTRMKVVISSDGRLALTVGEDGSLRLWDLEEGELVRRYEGQGSIYDATLAPDGKSVFFGTSEGTIIQWRMSNPSTGELLDWIEENRYLPELSCREREKYHVKPLCKGK